jgi:N-acetylglucosaminyldiphosphoundecaprenol N-acetyl-beta-D-mannosaminyltransferase
MEHFEKHTLLGLPINNITKESLHKSIVNSISSRKKMLIYGLCVGSMARLKHKKRNLPILLEQFDIVVPDGSAIPLLGKIFKVPIQETIPITELSLDCIKIANERKLTVFLLGASEDMNSLAVKKLREKFPDATIPDGISGYYTKDKEPEIVNRINSTQPDILLIGMSYPLKEEFAANFREQLVSTIIIPCGGAIDVFAGKTKRPPKFIKKMMLTWLYRWIQEPSRLKIGSDIRFLLITFPLLLIKHFLCIERNPSLLKHYKIN